MTDLFEHVLHHLEGTETKIQNWSTKTGMVSCSVTSFGPDRWIERAALGRLMAIDTLAVILSAVRTRFDLEQERCIVDGWSVELRTAVSSGEIQARDPVTLLALETLPAGWEWLISEADADKFVASRGMDWKISEQVKLHLEESRKSAPAHGGVVTAKALPESAEPIPHAVLANIQAAPDGAEAALVTGIREIGTPKPDSKPQAAPVVKGVVKSHTLWDKVTPYVIQIIKAGQPATAKQLFKALHDKAGKESPFEKGTGINLGSLYIPDINKTLALKTLQNRFPVLKKAARQ